MSAAATGPTRFSWMLRLNSSGLNAAQIRLMRRAAVSGWYATAGGCWDWRGIRLGQGLARCRMHAQMGKPSTAGRALSAARSCC